MRALAEIQVIPIGVGVSVRPQVKRAHQLLVESGLTVEAHAYGTNVEGELDDILAAIKRVHETLHAEGVVRIATSVKLGTRTDKLPSLAGKKLGQEPSRDHEAGPGDGGASGGRSAS